MPWSDSSPTTSSLNLLANSGDSASLASSPSSLAASPVRPRTNNNPLTDDAAVEIIGATDSIAATAESSPDLEPEISSPRQPQRSTLRAAFQLRKRTTNNAPGGGGTAVAGGGGDAGGAGDTPPHSARRRGSAGVTATLRSARNSEAPIDEEYVLKLLATPDLLNPTKMTADENRLFERLVVQLQLQLKALTGPPTPSTPSTPRAAHHAPTMAVALEQ